MYKYTLVDVKIPYSSPYAAAEPAPCFTRCLLLSHTYPASLGLVQMPALNPMDVPLSDHISEGAILLRFLTEGLEGGTATADPLSGRPYAYERAFQDAFALTVALLSLIHVMKSP